MLISDFYCWWFCNDNYFFRIIKILENQVTILYALEKQEEKQRKLLGQEKKVCSKCNKEYDYGSCPHCGNRDN